MVSCVTDPLPYSFESVWWRQSESISLTAGVVLENRHLTRTGKWVLLASVDLARYSVEFF